MSTPSGTAELLAAAQKAGTARPLVTFYDDASGERVELSATTFGNWVAKTTALLEDQGLARGDRVAVLLPVHWQVPVVLVSCWLLGAVPVLGGGYAGCGLAVAAADRLDEATGLGADAVAGLSLDAFGRPLVDPPAGVVDYAAEVPSYPDDLFVADPPEPSDPALDTGTETLSGTDVVALGVARAAAWGLETGGRLLTDLDPAGPGDAGDPAALDGVLAAAVAPLAVGGSVVLCRHLDRTVLDRRSATERVTCTALRPA